MKERPEVSQEGGCVGRWTSCCIWSGSLAQETNPAQLGRTSQGLEIAWSCCFFYKMVGEQLRFEGSKIRCQSLGLLLTCYATSGKLIYFSELDSLLVNWRFTSQSDWLHSLSHSGNTQLLLSRKGCSMCCQQWWTNVRPCRVQCCMELLGISWLLLLFLLLMSFVLRSNWN